MTHSYCRAARVKCSPLGSSQWFIHRKRYYYGYEESRSNHLCNRFFRRGCIPDRIGCWRTVGCLCNGRSIPGTVSSCIANRCNDPGGTPYRNGCRYIGSGWADLAQMVTSVSLARMGRGSLRGSESRPQSDHAKCRRASHMGANGIAPAHKQRLGGILKFIRDLRQVRPGDNVLPLTAPLRTSLWRQSSTCSRYAASARFHLCLPKGIGTVCGKVQASSFFGSSRFCQSSVILSHSR